RRARCRRRRSRRRTAGGVRAPPPRHAGPHRGPRVLAPRPGRDPRRTASRPSFARGRVPPDHGRSDAGAPVSTRAITAQARAELTLQMRRGENAIVTLAVPIGVLVFFAKVDAVTTNFADPVDFL